MRPGFNPPQAHLNVISSHGGLGDAIARLPAFRYVNREFKHVSQTVYVQDPWLDLCRFLLPESDRLQFKALSTAAFFIKDPVVDFGADRLSSLRLHLTEHAFLIMTDSLSESIREYEYPLASLVPETAEMTVTSPYVCFTTDSTAPARAWPVGHINGLATRLREQGLACVLLGRSTPIPAGDGVISPKAADGIDTSLFIDLRDKTSLIEALGVMQRSKAVVGVDNGLLHLACCTNVPVVIGYTSLKARHRVPFRKVNLTQFIEAAVPCGGCQSRGDFINHDWKYCIPEYNDYACTLTMTADKFYKCLQDLHVVPFDSI